MEAVNGFPGLSGIELLLATTAAAVLPAFTASFPSFFRSEFMRGAFCMRRTPALAGDLALLLRIHRCKTPIAASAWLLFISHIYASKLLGVHRHPDRAEFL
jgi:hypothetical protein